MKINQVQANNLAKAQDFDWVSIIILMVAAIIFVTAELLPVGLLPDISRSFHEPLGRVGLMVTGYAWTVAISAVLVTSYLAPLERRFLLLIITSLFAVANAWVACASSLNCLFLARILGAFSHGVFWSIVGSLCVRLSGNIAKARATAIVFGGIALASVIAVPIGTLLSAYLGWRIVFAILALMSLLVTLSIFWHFPKLPSTSHQHLLLLPELFKHPLIWRLCPATVLAITGHFCAFTYISVLLEKNMGIPSTYLAFYLFLFGGAGVIGNIIIGMLGDHQLLRTTQGLMTIMAIVIILCVCLPRGVSLAILCIMIWGMSICMLTVSLQSLILTLPSKLSDIASSLHVSMFNIGIGSGALLGGLLLDNFSSQIVALVSGGLILCAAIILSWPPKINQVTIY